MSQYPATINLFDIDGTNGFKISGKSVNDELGLSVSNAGDVNGDGIDDLIVGAPFANHHAGFQSGTGYVVFGKNGDFNAELNAATIHGPRGFTIVGEQAGGHVGYSVSGAGDVNGDGFGDIIIGCDQTDAPGDMSGASYVVFGAADIAPNFLLSSLDGENGFRISGAANYDFSGTSVSGAGDFNGDGFDDLIVGARYADANGDQSGASYIVFGQRHAFDADVNLSSLDGANGFRLVAEGDHNFEGHSVAGAGDVNGDGIDDIIIGAHGNDVNGNNSGAAYVVFGSDDPFGADLNLADLDGTNGYKIDGQTDGDFAGFSVASAGDVNGDGVADLIVGALRASPNGHFSGATYVVFGSETSPGAELDLGDLDGTNGFRIDGEAADGKSGASVKSAGDVNGDGFDDIIIGAYDDGTSGAGAGATYVVFGAADGFAADIDLSSLNGTNGFKLLGVAANDKSGWSVSGAGDVNNDGFDDMIIGARLAQPNGVNSGAAYVVFGRAPDASVTRTGTDASQTLAGGALADTLDGAGGNDKLYGNGGIDILRGGKGQDYLLGGGAGDDLSAGSGADTFAFRKISDSTGTGYDTITKLEVQRDLFDVLNAVTGVDAAITTGALSHADFDDERAFATSGGKLLANHAVVFTVTSGELTSATFLVIDQDGVAGYLGGHDLVIRLTDADHLDNLAADNFI